MGRTLVVVMLLAGCSGTLPQELQADAGCAAVDAGVDAGLEPVPCDSDAGISACFAAMTHRTGCCGTASSGYEPLSFCQVIQRVALDPVQRCEDIAAADCDTIRASGLCH